MKIISIDESISILAAKLYRELEKAGTPHRDDGDLLIAATAIHKGYCLITHDKGFEKMRRFGLKLHNEK
jgi:predicted nucleic acid-binding protein